METDAWGHVVKERRGNSAAMEVSREYWASTGRLASLCAGNQTTCNLMDEGYGWDAAGNLSSHQKETRYLETFTYDALNRLKTGTLAMQDGITANTALESIEYDLLGNVCRRFQLGGGDNGFRYAGRAGCGLGGANSSAGDGGTGLISPHQVSQTYRIMIMQAGGGQGAIARIGQGMAANYYYDARGNQTSKTSDSTVYNRSIGYSADDHAHELVSGNGQRTRFWYGSDGQRYKREDGSKRTLYLGNVEIVTGIGATTIKRTLAGALLQTIIGSTASHQYLFHDQLGNLARITDANGAVLNTQDYTAFGERRDPATQLPGGSAPTLTTRGFTGHEYVDGLDVIHMNGRIYDQTLGRFLQADPLIQAPDNAQSWNAYTYCFNNPLTYTDPSGMIGMKERQWLAAIVAIVYTLYTWDPEGGYSIYGLLGAMGVGFVSGAIATQSWEGGLRGAVTAGLTYGVGWGTYGQGDYFRVGAQAVTGGVVESLSGGQFGNGFVAAGVTAAFMPQLGQITDDPTRTIAGALLGGSMSVLTGGKFANGAVSGAIQAAMAGASDEPHRSQAGSGGGDGTQGAPVEIAELLGNPETRELGLRAMARSEGYSSLAHDIEYVDDYFVWKGERELGTAAVTRAGKITFYKPAFTTPYSALTSNLDHEAVHYYDMLSRGPSRTRYEVTRREMAAYRYQFSRQNFSQSPLTFQRTSIAWLRAYTAEFRTLTQEGP